MQRTTLVTAVIAAVVFGLVGWFAGFKSGKVAIPKHSHETKPCQGAADCKVDVLIKCVDINHPSADTCESYADKAEVITIDAKSPDIEFTIATKGFDFDQTNGIQFTTLNSGNKIFKCDPQGGSNKKYTCHNNGAAANTVYKYSIYIQGLDPTDPWVVNY